MEFPKLTLKTIFEEYDKKENKKIKDIVSSYNYEERDIKESNLRLNVVYEGVKVSQRSYYTNDYVIIENDNKYYVVMRLRSKDKFYPLVINLKQLDKVKNFETEEGKTGNWNFANKYVSFSRKNKTTMYYLHNVLMDYTPIHGKSIDHLNRITYDNRLENLQIKSFSEQNVNQKIRKCMSSNLDKMPEKYRKYYLENRPRYVYWIYSRTHGHRIYAGPVDTIKEKRFSSKDDSKIPFLMQKAENYLIEEANKRGLSFDKISSEFSPEVQKLKSSYYQIVKKALHFFDFEI